MTITVLAKKNYKNYTVIVRHFGYVFEYLFVYKKQLYSKHAVIKPVWWRRFKRQPFTDQQRMDAVNVMLNTARDHIDKLHMVSINKKP